jgi:hypothetical protein
MDRQTTDERAARQHDVGIHSGRPAREYVISRQNQPAGVAMLACSLGERVAAPTLAPQSRNGLAGAFKKPRTTGGEWATRRATAAVRVRHVFWNGRSVRMADDSAVRSVASKGATSLRHGTRTGPANGQEWEERARAAARSAPTDVSL